MKKTLLGDPHNMTLDPLLPSLSTCNRRQKVNKNSNNKKSEKIEER
jgi:hypothetical protein